MKTKPKDGETQMIETVNIARGSSQISQSELDD